MSAIDHQCLNAIYGPLENVAEGDPRLAQRDASPRDPRDIEEIVDQAPELFGCATSDEQRSTSTRLVQRSHGYRVADRGERISQPVPEHREKFVLRPTRDFRFIPRLLGDAQQL